MLSEAQQGEITALSILQYKYVSSVSNTGTQQR